MFSREIKAYAERGLKRRGKKKGEKKKRYLGVRMCPWRNIIHVENERSKRISLVKRKRLENHILEITACHDVFTCIYAQGVNIIIICIEIYNACDVEIVRR